MKALLSFYEEKYSLVIPDTYETFRRNICSVFQFPLTQFNELIIFYHDSDNDKIIVGNELDFEEMKKQIKNNEVKEIQLEVIEGSKLFVNRDMSKIKEDSVPIINKEEKRKEEMNISKQKDASLIDKLPYNILTNSQQKLVDINEPFINNDANSQPKAIISNQQNIPSEMIKNKINQSDVGKSFNYVCSLCNIFPIKELFYVCKKCNLFICDKCEDIYGFDHPHPLLKIRSINMLFEKENNVYSNNDQLPNKNNEDNSIFNSIKQVPDMIKNFLIGDEDEEDKQRERMIDKNQNARIIKSARLQFGLTQFSDEEILNALRKTKGNLNEAIILLVSK